MQGAKFFSMEGMAKGTAVCGPLPTGREAYRLNYDLAWPSVLESMLVYLISAMDIIMVGVLGPVAIAAVGLTNQPKLIVTSVLRSLNIGVTALVARRKGEDNREQANRILKQALVISCIASFLLTWVIYAFAEEILLFAGAQEDSLDMAVTYLQIVLIGNFFYCISLTINAAQRGVGKTKISMVTNLTANAINIVFNYFLINGVGPFPMLGVKGAAIATAMGNVAALALSILSVCHEDGYLSVVHFHDWRFDRRTLHGIFSISSSALAEQVFMRIGLFTYTRIVARLGTVAFAAHQICTNISNMSFAFGDGMSVASSALTGQSLGAKRPDLARIYGKVSQRSALVVSVFLCFFFIVLRRPLLLCFTDDAQVISMGMDVLVVIALMSLLQSTTLVYTGCLRGAGDTAYVAVMSLVSIALVRPIASWIFCYPLGFGLTGAWCGYLADQIVRFLFIFNRFRRDKWTTIEL